MVAILPRGNELMKYRFAKQRGESVYGWRMTWLYILGNHMNYTEYVTYTK